MPREPRFSRRTLEFIERASRQKKADWLDRNREEYEQTLFLPMQSFARQLKSALSHSANGYGFPQRGLARLKRSALGAREYGSPFRDYVSYSAARPRKSRFDHNPNLFFLLHPADEDGDRILVAGGLYMPSSRQLRALREAVARDASGFDRLFASKAFSARFPGGFSNERSSSRPPRGFDPQHPRLDWLKLQAFFVWRPYTLRELSSPGFADLVASDFRQILRLNALLDQALEGRAPQADAAIPVSRPGLVSRIEQFQAPRRKMDF